MYGFLKGAVEARRDMDSVFYSCCTFFAARATIGGFNRKICCRSGVAISDGQDYGPLLTLVTLSPISNCRARDCRSRECLKRTFSDFP